MEVHDHGEFGKAVILTAGDRLRVVPRSHWGLITDEVRAVFEDVPGYFAAMADRSPFPAMAGWLRALLREDRWGLVVKVDWLGQGRVWFAWQSETVLGAGVGLPRQADTGHLPGPLAALFSLVDFVDWSGSGDGEGDGRIFWPQPVYLLRANWIESGERIDLTKTLAWGGFNGHHLLAAPDNRGGWISTSSDVVLGGTVAETVDWWFAQLLAGRGPTMDAFVDSVRSKRGVA